MSKLSYILEEVILESRRKDVIKKYREILNDEFMENPAFLDSAHFNTFDDVLEWVEGNILHPKYLEFVLGGICCGGYGAEPEYMVELVNDFHKLSERNYIENKDIYSKEYQSPSDRPYADFNRLEEVINDALFKLDEKDKQKRLKKDKDIIYEDDRWRVIVPKTHEASCHYGAGTKWCTTSTDDEHFKSYTDIGIVYYIIDKTKISDQDDVMYKIAIFLRFRVTKDPELGDVYTALPINRAIEMFDSKDRDVNFEHVLPLLPGELENSILAYYYMKIKEKNSKVDFSVRKLFIKNNYLQKFVNKFYTKLQSNNLYNFMNGFGEFDWQKEDDSGGSVWFDFKDGESNYNIYLLGFASDIHTDSAPQLYELMIDGDEVNDILLSDSTLTHFIRINKNRGINDSIIVDRIIDHIVDEIISTMKRRIWGDKSEGWTNQSIKKDDIAYWDPNNSASTYKFKYPPKEGSLTHEFIKAVKETPGITPKEFYKEKYDFDYYSGYNTQFFGSIKDSGILRVEKGPYGVLKYYIGPNYEAWTKGNLKRFFGKYKPLHMR